MKALGDLKTPYDDPWLTDVPVEGEGIRQRGGADLENPGPGLSSARGVEPTFPMPAGGKATGNPLSGLPEAPETYDLPDAPADGSALDVPDTLDPGKNVGRK